MKTTWLSDTDGTAVYPQLDGDTACDVVIIGAGITGITTAYLLAKAGKQVILIDKNSIAESATSHTTAFLSNVIDTSITDLHRLLGAEKTRQVWDSHRVAIDTIEQIVEEEAIDCEFMRCPEYFYALSEDDMNEYEARAELANRFGFETRIVREADLGFQCTGYWEVHNQGKFHPLKYLLALRKRAAELGVRIYENTEATDISGDGPVYVETSRGTITTQHALIATYDPFNRPAKLLFHRGTYVSYIMELSVPKGRIPEAIYEDNNNPYNYFRIDAQADSDRMILGGADHRHEVHMDAEKNFYALESYLKEIVPDMLYTVVRKWYGPILEPIDGLAFIGHLNESGTQLVATGFSGNGMTYGTVSALMVRDQVLGEQNEWEALYDPGRIPTLAQLWQKGKDYTEEFIGGAAKNIFNSKDSSEEERK